jgi:hypothetical protein
VVALWQALAEQQAGVLSRQQALQAGLSAAAIDHRLVSGRWVRAHTGVYRTYTGPPDDRSAAWSAVLYAGAGAALDAAGSLWLAGAALKAPTAWAVLVPHGRQVRAQAGVTITAARRLDVWRHPVAAPPRLRLEAAVMRATELCARPAAVIDVVIGATAGRLTTAARLEHEMRQWRRLRWRRLLESLLEDVTDGVASALERRWRRDVEQAHGLPRATRNAAEAIGGRRRYRDLRYPGKVVAELDGQAAHPESGAFRDRERDNAAARQLDLALRYGWREVVGDPCGCAAEVGEVLGRQGWQGRLRRCGSQCTAVIGSTSGLSAAGG